MTMLTVLSMALALFASAAENTQDRLPVTLYGATKMATYLIHEGSVDDAQSSAGVCFVMDGESSPHCLEAREGSDRYFDSPEISFSPFPTGSSTQVGIFSAKQNFGGSGTALWLAAVIYVPSSSSVENILPKVVLSRQGDHLVWFDHVVSRFPLISTADITNAPDATVEGAHKYRVQTFYFDPAVGRYRALDSYTTKRAYNVFGNPTPISILSREKSTIKARVLRAVHTIRH